MRYQIPDSAQHRTEKESVAELLRRIGKPLRWIAGRTGISERRLHYILAGYRDAPSGKVPVQIKYPEQYTLEMLAQAVEFKDSIP